MLFGSRNSLAQFRWERARVRAISFSVGERKLINHSMVNASRKPRIAKVN
jgi:hypothetical protein